MAQRQNLRRRRITCWGCGGAWHLRSSCPRINKEDRNIKCWGCGRTGHVIRNLPSIPLPRSSDGNNNILVVIDYFTKWLEPYPILNQRGLNCCRGSSSTLDLTIRGPSTTALRSKEKLRFCSLQETVSAVHETTGYSPSQMLFGRDLRLPADLLFRRPPDAPLAPEEYIEKLQARMEEMHHLARERIGMASEKMRTRYDARATGHDSHKGDRLWL
ncbi:retrovirus-related Pol polyprotein from transposon 412 [Trichonephila clavipes]|nr:retrovirus-related Pol polyprotein from transposon 412 [Trichonephila clavipes]